MAKILNKDPATYQRERDGFIRDLQHFHETRGTPFRKVPKINGHEIDLYLLYVLVTAHGGWVKVNSKGDWELLVEHFHLSKNCVNSGVALKQIYCRYLDRYEKVHFLGEDVERGSDDDEDSRHRRWSARALHSVPLTYNHHQHNVAENLRSYNGLSADLYKPSDYDRLLLSLLSPLPNEQDFAINVCTLLSNEGRHTLRLDKCPRLIDILLAHAGIFNHPSMRTYFHELYGSVRCFPISQFWYDTLSSLELTDLMDESIYAEKKKDRRKCEIILDDIKTTGATSGCSGVNVKKEVSEKSLNSDEVSSKECAIDSNVEHMEVDCEEIPPNNKTDERTSCEENNMSDSVEMIESEKCESENNNRTCETNNETSETEKKHINLKIEPTDYELFCVGRTYGTQDYYGQRVLQISIILRNLSFVEENAAVMAKNSTYMRFVLLCAHSRWNSLFQVGMDMLGNIATDFLLEDLLNNRINSCVFNTVTNGLSSPDRFMIVSCLETLNRLCQKDENEEIIMRCLDQGVYEQVCSYLTLHDIMLLIHTLECLYSLSSLGEKSCNNIVRVHGAVDTLVSLITVEAQSYGPKACILMRVVETVTGTVATTTATSTTTVVTTSTAQSTSHVTTPVKQITPVTTPVKITPQKTVGNIQPNVVTSTTIGSPQATQQNQQQENEQFATNWLKTTYELSAGCRLEQAELYKQYLTACTRVGRRGVLTPQYFPRVVRSVFGSSVGPVQQRIASVITGSGTPAIETVQTYYEGLKVRSSPFSIGFQVSATCTTLNQPSAMIRKSPHVVAKTVTPPPPPRPPSVPTPPPTQPALTTTSPVPRITSPVIPRVASPVAPRITSPVVPPTVVSQVPTSSSDTSNLDISLPVSPAPASPILKAQLSAPPKPRDTPKGDVKSQVMAHPHLTQALLGASSGSSSGQNQTPKEAGGGCSTSLIKSLLATKVNHPGECMMPATSMMPATTTSVVCASGYNQPPAQVTQRQQQQRLLQQQLQSTPKDIVSTSAAVIVSNSSISSNQTKSIIVSPSPVPKLKTIATTVAIQLPVVTATSTVTSSHQPAVLVQPAVAVSQHSVLPSHTPAVTASVMVSRASTITAPTLPVSHPAAVTVSHPPPVTVSHTPNVTVTHPSVVVVSQPQTPTLSPSQPSAISVSHLPKVIERQVIDQRRIARINGARTIVPVSSQSESVKDGSCTVVTTVTSNNNMEVQPVPSTSIVTSSCVVENHILGGVLRGGRREPPQPPPPPLTPINSAATSVVQHARLSKPLSETCLPIGNTVIASVSKECGETNVVNISIPEDNENSMTSFENYLLNGLPGPIDLNTPPFDNNDSKDRQKPPSKPLMLADLLEKKIDRKDPPILNGIIGKELRIGEKGLELVDNHLERVLKDVALANSESTQQTEPILKHQTETVLKLSDDAALNRMRGQVIKHNPPSVIVSNNSNSVFKTVGTAMDGGSANSSEIIKTVCAETHTIVATKRAADVIKTEVDEDIPQVKRLHLVTNGIATPSLVKIEDPIIDDGRVKEDDLCLRTESALRAKEAENSCVKIENNAVVKIEEEPDLGEQVTASSTAANLYAALAASALEGEADLEIEPAPQQVIMKQETGGIQIVQGPGGSVRQAVFLGGSVDASGQQLIVAASPRQIIVSQGSLSQQNQQVLISAGGQITLQQGKSSSGHQTVPVLVQTGSGSTQRAQLAAVTPQAAQLVQTGQVVLTQSSSGQYILSPATGGQVQLVTGAGHSQQYIVSGGSSGAPHYVVAQPQTALVQGQTQTVLVAQTPQQQGTAAKTIIILQPQNSSSSAHQKVVVTPQGQPVVVTQVPRPVLQSSAISNASSTKHTPTTAAPVNATNSNSGSSTNVQQQQHHRQPLSSPPPRLPALSQQSMPVKQVMNSSNSPHVSYVRSTVSPNSPSPSVPSVQQSVQRPASQTQTTSITSTPPHTVITKTQTKPCPVTTTVHSLPTSLAAALSTTITKPVISSFQSKITKSYQGPRAQLQPQQQQQQQPQQSQSPAVSTGDANERLTSSPVSRVVKVTGNQTPVQVQQQKVSSQPSVPLDQGIFLCEWRGCMRNFRSANEVYLHACESHCPVGSDEIQCLWERCDAMKRKRFSLMTHLYDRHCNADVLRMMAVRRKQLSQSGRSEIPPPQPPPPHPGYAPNAALHAIKRHALEFVNPKELMKTPKPGPTVTSTQARTGGSPAEQDDNEGPVTKSIRLTSSLILRNLVIYSTNGRRFLRSYEPHLASVALSNVESSRTIAQVLYDMNQATTQR